jgi:hypothetical protein
VKKGSIETTKTTRKTKFLSPSAKLQFKILDAVGYGPAFFSHSPDNIDRY